MSKVVLADYLWCEQHAELTDEGWVCKKTRSEILYKIISRSLHNKSLPSSGGGEVVKVIHLYCLGCNPDWKGPEHGTSILPKQITEVEL